MLTLLVVRRVTRPLTSVTRSLTALAEGRSDVEIDCEDRADEIGEIARTVAVFKSNSLERARLRSEQTAATAAAAEQRKAELRNFVEEFRGSVGGILDKVLSSSGEFERVARQLTDTARSTADLSAQSAGASEKASEHVRIGGVSLRRTVPVDLRDHPPGAGIQRDLRRGGAGRPRPPISASRSSPRRARASATSSS